jgi:hypothetical protein
MSFRDDHDAALLRIEALELENAALRAQLCQLTQPIEQHQELAFDAGQPRWLHHTTRGLGMVVLSGLLTLVIGAMIVMAGSDTAEQRLLRAQAREQLARPSVPGPLDLR